MEHRTIKIKTKIILLAIIFFGVFGVAESSMAATYYVSTSGTDTNPGTAALPWRNIQKAADIMVAGDEVIVKSGTYYETVMPRNSGQPGKLITFKVNPGDKVIIDGQGTRQFGFFLDLGNYVRVEGFEITGVTGHGIIVCWSSYCGLGFEIVNNIIHDNPNCSYCGGVYTQQSVGGLVQGNKIYNNGGDGIGIGGKTITIRQNEIYNNQDDGIKGGVNENLLIEGNIIHSMTSVANHGDCMQLMGCQGTTIVRNNTTWDCTQNIYLDDYSATPGTYPWGDAYIYNNVVYNSQYVDSNNEGFYNGIVAGPRFNNWNSLNIFNNTLVDLNDGNGGIGGGGINNDSGYKINSVKIYNNLFYNSVFNFAPSSNVVSDYNYFYQDKRTWYMPGWLNLADFKLKYLNSDQHSQYGDPSFVNNSFPNPDFHLKSGSTAINSGTALPAIDNIQFDFDRDDITRPQGTSWDIGAYEFQSGSSDTTPPAAPSGLTVN